MKGKKHPGRGAKVTYPSICWAARRLGVSRFHLTEVLKGKRDGRPGLAEGYERLKAERAELKTVHGEVFAANAPLLRRIKRKAVEK